MDTAIPIIVLLALMLVGVPIAFSLIASGLLGIYLFTHDWGMLLGIAATVPYSNVASYVLMTVPMFIIMAYFASCAGLAGELYDAASTWMRPVRGGLAMATVFSCAVFGAMCGSTTAAASVMTNIALPNMLRHGYSKELSCGVIGIGATISILIPPSIMMIVYGIMTNIAIDKLFMAGLIPGIILTILLASAVAIWVRVQPSAAPSTESTTWAERWRCLRPIWASILVIVLVLGILYSGVSTPSEVGALGAMAALTVGLIKRRLTFSNVLDAVKSTVVTTGMIFVVIMGAAVFGAFLALSQLPQNLTAYIVDAGFNRWVIITAVIACYFIMSMIMDEIPLVVITLPLIYPLITKLGFDPIWYGVIQTLMVCMGLVFPPVGLVAIVISAVGKVDVVTVYKGCMILIVTIFLTTAICMLFPQTALWIPSKM